MRGVQACCINENPTVDDPFAVQMCLGKNYRKLKPFTLIGPNCFGRVQIYLFEQVQNGFDQTKNNFSPLNFTF